MTSRKTFAGTWWRPRALWSLGGVAVLAGAIVWLSQPGDGTAATDEAPALASGPADHDALRPLPATLREEPGVAFGSRRPSGSELIEVCGLGWVEPDASGALDTGAVKAVPDVVASQRALLASLRRTDGEFGVAVATVLALHGALRDDTTATPASVPCAGAECAPGDDEKQPTAGLLEKLAKQATATLDPRVYALAMKECERHPAEGSCALLNLEQWARLDDGNAVPWLHLLKRARQGNDATQVLEALYRIGTAARVDERVFAAAGRIADHAAAGDLDTIAAQLLAVDAFVQASASQSPFEPLSAACSEAALADANRRQACDSAAAALAERSDSLMALAVGTALGRRLGWPDERVDALRGLEFARTAMAREGEGGAAAASPVAVASTCAGARRMLAMFSRQGRAGEVQPVRDWLAANGRSIAPYAKQAHEMIRQRDDATPKSADARAAADAASAAPSPELVVAQRAGATPYSEVPPPAR